MSNIALSSNLTLLSGEQPKVAHCCTSQGHTVISLKNPTRNRTKGREGARRPFWKKGCITLCCLVTRRMSARKQLCDWSGACGTSILTMYAMWTKMPFVLLPHHEDVTSSTSSTKWRRCPLTCYKWDGALFDLGQPISKSAA